MKIRGLSTPLPKLLCIPIGYVVAYGEGSRGGWRGGVKDVDAAIGSFDTEIVSGVALPIEEHSPDSRSAWTYVVHSEGGNEML